MQLTNLTRHDYEIVIITLKFCDRRRIEVVLQPGEQSGLRLGSVDGKSASKIQTA